jgi:hypothetical protein
MIIERVRSAVRTEPVRRLMESAPTADEVRSAISEGLDALGSSLGTIAEGVDRSTEAVRDRVVVPAQLADLPAHVADQLADLPAHLADQLADLPEQLGLRKPPARAAIPRPLIALAGAEFGLASGFVFARMDRLAWTTLRDRTVRIASRTARRVGALGRHAANEVRGVAAVGTRSITPDEPVTDDVLAERARSALGRVRGLHAIRIEADEGVVTLYGRVEPQEREHALTTLRSVRGVRDVDDRLTTESTSGPTEGGGNGSAEWGRRTGDSAPGSGQTGTDTLSGERASEELTTGSSTPARP